MSRRRSFRKVIEAHFVEFRKSQRHTIHDLSMGLLNRGRLGLAEVARGMADRTTVRHRIKRAWRFGRNEAVTSEKATRGLARGMLSSDEETVIALDWTDLGDYVLLAAKVAIDRRTAPLAWAVMTKGQFRRGARSRNHVEEQVIWRLREVLSGRRWVLVADRGFARADLFRKLGVWGVRYVIRAPGNPWIRTRRYRGILDSLTRRPRRAVRYEQVLYHKTRRVPVHLVVTHEEPAPEPWYLVTNVEGIREVVRIYRKRMWIEEGFRDAKSGLGLSHFRMPRPERIERMLILVAVVMLLSILVGLDYRCRHGNRDPQLTTKRKGRTLSVFRLGLELIRQHGLPPGICRMKLITPSGVT